MFALAALALSLSGVLLCACVVFVFVWGRGCFSICVFVGSVCDIYIFKKNKKRVCLCARAC